MSFNILGLGTAVPPHNMTQSEAYELAIKLAQPEAGTARALKVLYHKSGVQQRRTAIPHERALDFQIPPDGAAQQSQSGPQSAPQSGPSMRERMQLFEEHALPLAAEAARHALADAHLPPEKISHLITVCCTGFAAPGVDLGLIRLLRLPPTTERIHVGFMGCHGALNGMRAGLAITTAQPAARVLLCAVELCSLHFRFGWDPERFLGNVLFADGAGAVVGGAGGSGWQVVASGSCLLPDSLDAMTWKLGNHGFEMTVSPRVPDLIRQYLRPWLSDWLKRQNLSLNEIESWAIHPGGPRILSAVSECLELPASATTVSREILANYGNMSSPTVLFILEQLRQVRAPTPCVALAFGPGLAAEVLLIR